MSDRPYFGRGRQRPWGWMTLHRGTGASTSAVSVGSTRRGKGQDTPGHRRTPRDEFWQECREQQFRKRPRHWRHSLHSPRRRAGLHPAPIVPLPLLVPAAARSLGRFCFRQGCTSGEGLHVRARRRARCVHVRNLVEKRSTSLWRREEGGTHWVAKSRHRQAGSRLHLGSMNA